MRMGRRVTAGLHLPPTSAMLLCACVSVCAQSAASTPTASPQTQSPAAISPQSTATNSLTLDEALKLANAQASAFQTAKLNERSAAEDVRQAQAAFLPKVSAPLSYIYTSPVIGAKPGTPREQSFIANNAIAEYQAFVNVEGDFDIAGKLRATLAKNRA